eukprot:747751-Hanusia_phi.AAC.2
MRAHKVRHWEAEANDAMTGKGTGADQDPVHRVQVGGGENQGDAAYQKAVQCLKEKKLADGFAAIERAHQSYSR